jgi:hypothetical protein
VPATAGCRFELLELFGGDDFNDQAPAA